MKKQGVPELVEAVAAGRVAVSVACRIARLPGEQQKGVLAGIQRGLKPKQALAQIKETPQDGRWLDDAGRPVPEQVVPAFQQRKELRALCRQMDALSQEVARLGDYPIGLFLDRQLVQSHLHEAKQAVWSAQPAHVCPDAGGARAVA